ncbi:MAG: hypothetical protein GF409_06765 [Candidatus Omnitrophica bacterium]|nr:hypothetical protein [Candidatus Omnitrophota bacterium]
MKKIGIRLPGGKKIEKILQQLDYMDVQMKRLEQEVVFYRKQLSGVRKAQEDFFEAGRLEQRRSSKGLHSELDQALDRLQTEVRQVRERNERLSKNQRAMKDLFLKALEAVREKETVIHELTRQNESLRQKSAARPQPACSGSEMEKSIDALMKQIAEMDTPESA